jgi:hypothetical protein
MENKNKDTPFLLTNFIEQQATSKYNGIQREIDNKGYINFNTDTDSVKVYSRELAEILISNSLPARNLDTKTETTINGKEYQNTFVEGYKEGEQYFEAEWKVSSNTLYGGAGAEHYVRDIHLNFFQVRHSTNSINIQGWGGVKKNCPHILTHKAVKDFGFYSGIVNKVEEQVNKYRNLFISFEKENHNLPPQQNETKTELGTIEMKPVLKPEAVQIVFDIIKDFFNSEQQAELKRVIQTGNKASNKLLFKSNGNRLSDTFKKLIEHEYITGCQKQDLINWIILNFTYTQKNKVKEFIYDTVEKTISRNDNPCKSPLIEIVKGEIRKVEQPRTKGHNKN